ncbi:MAG: cysteine hydrolase family protein [Rubrobacteraceae bacterium]
MTNTALIVIDVQNAMVEEAHRKEELLKNIGWLLERARSTETPIIFMQHDDDEYEPMMPGEPGWQIHESMATREDEPVIRKRFSDSFYDTSLEEELRSRGVGRLIVAGMSTEYCVDRRVGAERGYGVTLAGDAHTTGGDEIREMMGQGFISAEQIVARHNFLLGGIHNARPGREIAVRKASEIEFA